MLKIAFVGIGSIGKRHFRDLCMFLNQKKRSYMIDVYRSGKGAAIEPDLASNIHREIWLSNNMAVSEYYDVVFITNPTAVHYETIRHFAGSARAMFIEKPVFDNPYADLNALRLQQDVIYYVACPLRCHPVIKYVQTYIPYDQAYAVRAISSSYLPDWRPGTDYRICYSARQSLGGGVDIDLIHEWDYLTYLFGPVKSGFAIRKKFSDLEIDSNDYAAYIAQTEHTAIEVHLDYFGRKSIRQLQIFLPEDTVECDILTGDIYWRVSGEHVHLDNERDGYQMRELQHFFEILDGKCSNDSNIADALRVLRYARGDFEK